MIFFFFFFENRTEVLLKVDYKTSTVVTAVHKTIQYQKGNGVRIHQPFSRTFFASPRFCKFERKATSERPNQSDDGLLSNLENKTKNVLIRTLKFSVEQRGV